MAELTRAIEIRNRGTIQRLRKEIRETREARAHALRLWDIVFELGDTLHPGAIKPILEADDKIGPAGLMGIIDSGRAKWRDGVRRSLRSIYDNSAGSKHPSFLALQAVVPHFSQNEDYAVQMQAIRQAIKSPNRFKRPRMVKLFIKQLRAMHGRLK